MSTMFLFPMIYSRSCHYITSCHQTLWTLLTSAHKKYLTVTCGLFKVNDSNGGTFFQVTAPKFLPPPEPLCGWNIFRVGLCSLILSGLTWSLRSCLPEPLLSGRMTVYSQLCFLKGGRPALLGLVEILSTRTILPHRLHTVTKRMCSWKYELSRVLLAVLFSTGLFPSRLRIYTARVAPSHPEICQDD